MDARRHDDLLRRAMHRTRRAQVVRERMAQRREPAARRVSQQIGPQPPPVFRVQPAPDARRKARHVRHARHERAALPLRDARARDQPRAARRKHGAVAASTARRRCRRRRSRRARCRRRTCRAPSPTTHSPPARVARTPASPYCARRPVRPRATATTAPSRPPAIRATGSPAATADAVAGRSAGALAAVEPLRQPVGQARSRGIELAPIDLLKWL